jgi:hypothetical protein
MKFRDRVVNVMPVQALWTEDGELPGGRGRRLDRNELRELLRRGPVRFVVASIGEPLRWIPVAEQFEFWKTEVTIHLSESERVDLEHCPNGLAYVASEWLCADSEPPMVLLEVHH